MDDGLESQQMVWEVGGLALALADALAARFNPVKVRGEIAGFARAASGHCYFTLKDAQGQLRCALFRRQTTTLRFQPKDGDVVEVEGRLDVYAPRGDLQLLVDALALAGGQGQWIAQFFQSKARLEALGLFDVQRKRSLNLYPQSIGVVTSLGAAALHDVVTALRRRVPHIPVHIFPAAVQGRQASEELLSALNQVLLHQEHSSVPCDVLLLVRGGGSFEDLWAFNDERLAYAIAQCPVPVVTGIGHETDFTIADFVADVRAPTPTAAAELCAHPRQALALQANNLNTRLADVAQQRLDREVQRLDHCTQSLVRPAQRLAQEQQRLAQFKYRLIQSTERGLDRQRQHLLLHQHALQALDPKLVLERGYAWLSDAQGRVLSHVSSVDKDMEIKATLVDGEVALRVL